MIAYLKSLLVHTFFYRYLLKVRSFFQHVRVSFSSLHDYKNTTVYCVSPFKTGTTYFSGLFECESFHEPLMYTTIRHIDDVVFLKKRASYLSLDLECSGFFADKLDLLRKFAPDSRVVFISRHPEEWIGSVVNYFSGLEEKLSYNYVARLVFDPICTFPVDKFYSLCSDQQRYIVDSLMKYWIQVYSSAAADQLSMVVKLEELDQSVRDVENFTGLKAVGGNGVWRRENPSKKSFSLVDYIDVSLYADKVRRLGYAI